MGFNSGFKGLITSALDGGYPSSSRPGLFIPDKETRYPLNRWWGEWGAARDSPNSLIEEKSVAPAGRYCLIFVTYGTSLIFFLLSNKLFG